MIYLSQNTELKFSYSYQELKSLYEKIVNMNDTEFLDNLKMIIHTTIFICYIKEIPNHIILSDDGLIHELAHLLNEIETVTSLSSIRLTFKELLRL